MIKMFLLSFACFICFGNCTEAFADNASAKIDPALDRLGSDTEISVIVTLKDNINIRKYRRGNKKQRRTKLIKALKTNAKKTQKKTRDFLKRNNIEHIDLWLNNAILLKAKTGFIRELAQISEIEKIVLDQTVLLQEPILSAVTTAEQNLNIINAPAAWDIGLTGSGIVIAGMDTGVDIFHQDLNDNFRGGTNSWKDFFQNEPAPVDLNGHGTQTMGIMAGGDPNSPTIGVAPGAKWIAVRIFDNSDPPETTFGKIHQGFQWFLDPDNDPNTNDTPDIINNSWGVRNSLNDCVLEFYNDIETLKTAGVAVVFSAGNDGPDPNTSLFPANYDNALAVGAIDNSLVITDFSSRGPSPCRQEVFPNIVAPGKAIRTSDLTGGAFPDTYTIVSGTSLAAPHVAGAIALLLEAFPDLDPWQIEMSFEFTALDLGTEGPENDYGYGLIDIAAAYERVAGPDCFFDFDKNGIVAVNDFAVIANEWLRNDCDDFPRCKSDFDYDNNVNINDLKVFLENWLNVCSAI